MVFRLGTIGARREPSVGRRDPIGRGRGSASRNRATRSRRRGRRASRSARRPADAAGALTGPAVAGRRIEPGVDRRPLAVTRATCESTPPMGRPCTSSPWSCPTCGLAPIRRFGLGLALLFAAAAGPGEDDRSPTATSRGLKVARPEDKAGRRRPPRRPGRDRPLRRQGPRRVGQHRRQVARPAGSSSTGGAMQVKGGGIMTKQELRRPFQAPRRVPRPLHARRRRARGGATAASTSRGATRSRSSTATASTARTTTAAASTRSPAPGQRLQGPDRLAELRHRLPRPGLRGRQEGRSRRGSASSRTACRSTRTSRSRSTTPSPASAATRASPARSCSRTTATRSSTATSGSRSWTRAGCFAGRPIRPAWRGSPRTPRGSPTTAGRGRGFPPGGGSRRCRGSSLALGPIGVDEVDRRVARGEVQPIGQERRGLGTRHVAGVADDGVLDLAVARVDRGGEVAEVHARLAEGPSRRERQERDRQRVDVSARVRLAAGPVEEGRARDAEHRVVEVFVAVEHRIDVDREAARPPIDASRRGGGGPASPRGRRRSAEARASRGGYSRRRRTSRETRPRRIARPGDRPSSAGSEVPRQGATPTFPSSTPPPRVATAAPGELA